MNIQIDQVIDKHYNYKKPKRFIDAYMDKYCLVVCNYCELIKHVTETGNEDDLVVCNECYPINHAKGA